jgi:biotin operon repressor
VAELVKGTPLEEAYRKDPEATPFRLLRAALALALSSAHERGYKVKGLSQATFHLPVELLAKALGIDRTTLWRNLAPLEEAGLVATARHLGRLAGRVATTGTIWAVVLQPGRRARLRYEDLAHPWRDLDLDRKQGKTAFNVLKAVKKGFRITFRFLLDWALGRRPTPWSPPPTGDELEDILSLPGLAPQERPDLIDRLSATIAWKLGDPGSRRYYAGLLWRVVEGQLRPEALLTLIRRAMAAIGEGVARPGALVAQALGRL